MHGGIPHPQISLMRRYNELTKSWQRQDLHQQPIGLRGAQEGAEVTEPGAAQCQVPPLRRSWSATWWGQQGSTAGKRLLRLGSGSAVSARGTRGCECPRVPGRELVVWRSK